MTACSVHWCERPTNRGGLCNAHYQRQRDGRDMDAPIRTWPSKTLPDRCEHDGCTAAHYSAGFCQLHYHRSYKGRPLDGPRRRSPKVPGKSTRRTQAGYVQVWLPDHPNARSGWTMRHRYVMEQQIGRHLLPDESVHHVNGVKDDNRPENLELWASTQPSGQRVSDLLAWAHDIIARYESAPAPSP